VGLASRAQRARGDADKALAIREALADRVGADLSAVKPGSDQAFALKDALIAKSKLTNPEGRPCHLDFDSRVSQLVDIECF
jgi:hypothetical protein